MTQKELARAAYNLLLTCEPEKVGELNATEVARRLNVSLPNLSRAFKTHKRFTLKYYLEYTQVSAFEHLMACKKAATVREALDILDIRSYNSFLKTYKKHRKRTPGQFMAHLWRVVRKFREGKMKPFQSFVDNGAASHDAPVSPKDDKN